MSDPFATLGLARDASMEDAKKAYRKLAMQHHPDRNMGDAVAEAKFKQIASAWEQVQAGWRPGMPPPGEPVRPNPFHAQAGPGGFGMSGFEFSFNTGHGQQPLDDIMAAMNAQRMRRNRDYNVACTISLTDAFAGAEVTIPIRTPNEERTVTVTLPPGIDSGNRMRVPQAGENVFPQFQPGDLYVTIQIAHHPVFTRVGPDLLMTISVDVLDLLLGCAVTVSGIDTTSLEVKVPACFDPANRLRLSGHGMPTGQPGKPRGDLFVSVMPRYSALKPEQAALVEQARALR